jgi:ABC-type antimicrobial peptide transport system permease subunit
MTTSKLDQLKIEREPERVSRSSRWPLIIIIVIVLAAGLYWLFLKPDTAISVRTVVAREISSFSAITFAFDVNFKLLAQGIIFAMVIGLIGGLLPAIRAARQPVAQALRGL